MHMYFAMLPIDLDLNEHIANYPPNEYDFKSKAKFNLDNAKLILGSLTSVIAIEKDLIEEDGYVPLNATFLNGFMTDYNHYLNYLKATGVIECNGRYIPSTSTQKGESRKYRWADKYQNQDFKAVYFEKFLNKKGVFDIQPDLYLDTSTLLINDSIQEIYYEYLYHWYEQRQLQINNIDLAFEYAKALKDQKLRLGYEHWDDNTGKPKNRNPKNRKKNPIEQYKAIKYSLESLKIHDYKVHIDGNVHRLHSILTNMQKDFRSFTTYDNEQLVSIDISNSQPYLLTLLLNNNFWLGNTPINIINLPDNIKLNLTNTLPIMLGKLTEGLPSNENVKKYIQSVSTGQFYENMQYFASQKLGVEYSRKKIKPITFEVFFSKNGYFNQPQAKLKRLFAEVYPEVYQVIEAIKESDHCYLACLLQTIESEIILHKCSKRIWVETNKQVPIFTIHDSIVTTVGNEKYVAQVMFEELSSCIGVTPHLKFEYWSEKELDQELYEQITIQ